MVRYHFEYNKRIVFKCEIRSLHSETSSRRERNSIRIIKIEFSSNAQLLKRRRDKSTEGELGAQ